MLSLTIGEAREESMPVFDPEQRRRLHRYSSDHRMWFQDWLLNPVSKAARGSGIRDKVNNTFKRPRPVLVRTGS